MSASADTPTPKFSRPPIIEVAISVQFEELQKFNIAHFGLLWTWWRDRYPNTSHQPPLRPVIESFESGRIRTYEVKLEPGFPVGRCWYENEDHTRLIQVQPDRFILNWRKGIGRAPYPSYDALRNEFTSELNTFLEFLDKNRLGAFDPTQCELIYVNHLEQGREWKRPRDLSTVLVPLAEQVPQEGSLPEVEDLRLAWRYRYETEGSLLGRLHVNVQSSERTEDSMPVFVMKLTARGAPLGSGVEEVLEFTDMAHGWITRGFAAITTDRVHGMWGRER